MLNHICNRLQLKSQLTPQTQPRKGVNPHLSNPRPKQILKNEHLKIERENQHLVARIKTIQSLRSSSSMSKLKDHRNHSKALSFNKRKATEIKKKELEEENKRMVKKLLTTSSSLRKYRVDRHQNSQQKRRRAKKISAILQMSKTPQKRRIFTEGITRTESRIQEIYEEIDKFGEVEGGL